MEQPDEASLGNFRALRLNLNDAMGSALIMMYIIDLLPWEDEADGKTVREIGVHLARIGIHAEVRTLQRVMQRLMKCANVEWTDGKPRRFKRFHPQRTSACLAEGYALPQLDSEIRFDARSVTR